MQYDLDNRNTLEEVFVQEGSDWYATFNPDVRRPMSVRQVQRYSHSSIVCSVKFSADASLLAVGIKDEVVLYDRPNNLKYSYPIPAPPPADDGEPKPNHARCVAISPDGTLLAAGSEDTYVRLWHIPTGSFLTTLVGHRGEVYGLAFSSTSPSTSTPSSPSETTLLSASADGTIHVWPLAPLYATDTDTGTNADTPSSKDGIQPLKVLVAPQSAEQRKPPVLTSVSVSPDGALVVGGSLDNAVRVWDLRSAGVVAEEGEVAQHPNRLKLNNNNNTSNNNSSSGGSSSAEPGAEAAAVYAAHFIPSVGGGFGGGSEWDVLSAGTDKALTLWKVSGEAGKIRGEGVKTLRGHRAAIACASVALVGRKIYAASGSTTGAQTDAPGAEASASVRMWDVKDGKTMFVLRGHRNTVTSVDLSKDGSLLVTGSGDCDVRVWEYSLS